MRTNGTVTPAEALEIYVQDHHAGSEGGVSLAHRAAENQADLPWGPRLRAVAVEIEEDARILERILDQLGISPSKVKDAAANVGEWLGRFKLNGQLTGSSPLAPVIELEALSAAVTAKSHLWESLKTSPVADVDDVEMDRLFDRAIGQRDRIQEMWREATTRAFGDGS